MKTLRSSAGIAVAAARIGFADLASIYTVRTWVFGWFARLVTQAIFFSLFGLLLGSVSLAQYRAVGNAAALVCIEAMAATITVVRERGEGTLALQVLAPAPFVLTYVARPACNLIVGIGSSTAGFVIVALVFRMQVAMPEALATPLLLAVMGLASYCFALAIGAIVMMRPGLQWLAVNVGYLSVMTFAGVNVPIAFWPAPVRAAAQLLPLSHGLDGLRRLLAGGSYLTILSDMSLELCVALTWAALAVALLTRAVSAGRRNGTLELSAF